MFENLCRLCGVETGRLSNIFDNTNNASETAIQIQSVLHFQIHKDEILPTRICSACLTELQRAFDFITHCLNVQKSLKELCKSREKNSEVVNSNVGQISVQTIHSKSPAVAYSHDERKETRVQAKDFEESSEYYNRFDKVVCTQKDAAVGSNLTQNPSLRKEAESSESNGRQLQETFSRVSLHNAITTMALSLRQFNLQYSAHELDKIESEEDRNSNHSDDENKMRCSKDELLAEFDHLNSSAEDEALKSENRTNANVHTDPAIGEKFENEKKKLICAVCKTMFSLVSAYEEHLNLHTGNRPFTCKLCKSTFRKRQDLNQHLRTIHSEKQFKCSHCSYIAKHKGKLTEHVKSIHEKPFTCSMCNYRTGEKGKLLQHVANKHTCGFSFVCEICGNGFKTKNSLLLHRQNIHFPKPKVCETCGKVCPSLAKYHAHIFRCGKEKQRYSCDACGKTYANKEILRDHMNKHLNIKPYKCDLCLKEFFLRNRLDTHKFVHRGLSYGCEVCGQAFKRKDNMKNHMKKHSSL